MLNIMLFTSSYTFVEIAIAGFVFFILKNIYFAEYIMFRMFA